MLSDSDLGHLQRCVDLAEEALMAGNDPFGSMLVGPEGSVIAEFRNAVGSGDATRHPELELVRWAVERMTPAERAACTVYTSAEHCAMCSAAHAWVGLGRIVYASSTAETASLFAGDLGAPVMPLPIEKVAPTVDAAGPAPGLAARIAALYQRARLHGVSTPRTVGDGAREKRAEGVDDVDLAHLRRCVELAAEAVDDGDEAFGSLLVGPDGAVLAEDRNRVADGDRTRHPELELARWAAAHLSPEQRAASTIYTSGEHCAMCAAAHAWVGLGRIVVATSTEQTHGWFAELGLPPAPVAALPIRAVAPGIRVDGPVPELAEEIRALHRRAFASGGG